MRNDRELQKAVLAVMLGKKEEVAETVKHPNQQKLDVHEPEKDELTAKDFEMLRAGKKAKMKEEVEIDDEADETILVHTPIEFELQEKYNFGDYLTIAKQLVGEEEAINLANEAFQKQDTSIFMENFMRSDIEDKVKVHQKAGHKVSTPKYMTKSGKPYAEYVVTDKESGVRRKYIHHGNARSVENMGAAGKRDEE